MGAWLGAVAFTAGLAVETALVTLADAPTPKLPERTDAEVDGEDRVLAFSTPLMLSVMLWWSTPLIISAVLARTPEPDCSLAAFTVVEAVAWFLTAPVGQLQHASLALVDCRPAHQRIRIYAGGLAVTVLEPAGLAFPVAAL